MVDTLEATGLSSTFALCLAEWAKIDVMTESEERVFFSREAAGDAVSDAAQRAPGIPVTAFSARGNDQEEEQLPQGFP